MDLEALKANKQLYRGCLCPSHTAIRELVAEVERLQHMLNCPCGDPTSVDENGCHTAPDGSCISAGPCLHTTDSRTLTDAPTTRSETLSQGPPQTQSPTDGTREYHTP